MIVYVDCETTGLDASKHGLIEVTAALCDFDLVELDRWQSGVMRVPASARIDAKALEVNGFSLDEIQNSQISDVLAAHGFVAMLKTWKMAGGGDKFTLAGHNAGFDWGFLKAWVPDLEDYFSHRKLDFQALAIARNIDRNEPNKSSSLDNVCKDLGIVRGVKHRSDADVTDGLAVGRRLMALIFGNHA